jgi:hypothetical protein
MHWTSQILGARGARKGAALPRRYWQPGLAGLLAGIVFFMLSALTFYVLGVVPGILFNPEIQSPKVIAVVQVLQPPPLMQRAPYIVFAAWTVTLIGYSYLFHHLRPLWPQGYWSCLWRLALMIWFFSLLFFSVSRAVESYGRAVIALCAGVAFLGDLRSGSRCRDRGRAATQ